MNIQNKLHDNTNHNMLIHEIQLTTQINRERLNRIA